jgi:hypothetical protein
MVRHRQEPDLEEDDHNMAIEEDTILGRVIVGQDIVGLAGQDIVGVAVQDIVELADQDIVELADQDIELEVIAQGNTEAAVHN